MRGVVIDSFTGPYAFLSNFYAAPVGKWPTVEHYFQASKSRLNADWERISNAPTPSAAKYEGRRVALRPDWDAVKLGVMRSGLAMKFSDIRLAAKLLETGDALLIEGNTWGDRFWGQVNGIGENWLGHLLMARRAELRATS